MLMFHLDELRFTAFRIKRRLLGPIRRVFPIFINRVDEPRDTAAQCINCGRFVRARSYHLGFSDLLALYCSSCEGVLLVGTDVDYRDLLPPRDRLSQGDYGSWELPYWQTIERLFAPCPCGGSFGYLNPPRCPHCHAPIAGDVFAGKVALKQRERYCFLSGKQVDGANALLDRSRLRVTR